MAHTFNSIPAKPTFGRLRQNLYQSDYINRKKGIINFCRFPNATCKKVNVSSSYYLINSYNLGKYTLNLDKCNIIPVNKSNLIIGQYSAANLSNVCTVQPSSPYTKPTPCGDNIPCNPCQNNTPVIVSPGTVFYQNNIIDPLGELFGKTPCGELNYTHFMVFNPPTSSLTISNF